MTPSRLVATGLGLGLLRPAPGSWASAAAIAPAYLLHGLGGFPLLCLGILAALAAGLWSARVQEEMTGTHDASEIVMDEIAGMWIALLPLSGGLWFAGADPWLFPWPGWVGAFLAFRLFDIWKPGPVGWADRRPGAIGVMLDDVIAGALAAFCVIVTAGLAHGIFGV